MERRRFFKYLIGSGGLVIVLVALGSDDEVNDYEGERRELEALAEQIDQVDLASPSETFSLPNDIREATSKIDTAIETHSVEQAGIGATLYQSGNGLRSILLSREDSADLSETEAEIEAIESALTYYEGLRQYLLEASRISDHLYSIERGFTTASEQPDQPPEIRLDHLESQLDDFKQVNEELQSNDRLVSDLLPDQKKTLEEIHRLKSVYEAFEEVQANLMSVGENVSDGAIEHEQGEADVAKELFDTAIAQSTIDIQTELQEYSLAQNSLSLSNYTGILDDYYTAAKKMQESYDNSDSRASNRLFDEGLDAIFVARERIERTVSL